MIKQVKPRMKAVLVLALAVILGISGLEVRATDIVGKYIASGEGWSLDEEGTLIIEKQEGMTEWVDGASVSQYEGIYLFNMVESVVIKEGVTSIGEYAFQGSQIKEVTIPSTVTVIEELAFGGCKNLTKITIPSKVEEVRNSAFEGAALTEVIFEGSPQVGVYALGCETLTSVVCKSATAVGFHQSSFKTQSLGGASYSSQVTFQIPQGSTDNYKEALKDTGYDESKLVEEIVTTPESGSGTEEEKPDSSQPGSGTEGEKPDSSQPGSGSSTEEEKPDSSQPGSGSGTEEEKPGNIQEGSGSNTEGENSDITQGEGNSQSKPEIETPSDKENTSGMITNSPMVEGNRAVGTETGYYPQDRREEQVPKISYATTSSVAGQKSTVSGVFILNKGINVAVRTPQEQLKADFLLETNERLFVKILDMDLKKSNLAKASLDSIMTSVGGKPVAYLNIEMGTMKNGVYKGITESDKTISYAVEISPKDNLEKFDVIRVREGGKLDILKSQYSKGVITFETTPALGAYLIISY